MSTLMFHRERERDLRDEHFRIIYSYFWKKRNSLVNKQIEINFSTKILFLPSYYYPLFRRLLIFIKPFDKIPKIVQR